MPVTIELNDALAAQLQSKAAARQLSLEEFALNLLGGAVGQIESADRWRSQNQRRLELIRTSCARALSAHEQVELQQLQDSLDLRLEPLDDCLLNRLQDWQSALDKLTGDADL